MKLCKIGSFDVNFDKNFYDSKLKEIRAIDSITLGMSQNDINEYDIRRVITVSNKTICVTFEHLTDFKGKN